MKNIKIFFVLLLAIFTIVACNKDFQTADFQADNVEALQDGDYEFEYDTDLEIPESDLLEERAAKISMAYLDASNHPKVAANDACVKDKHVGLYTVAAEEQIAGFTLHGTEFFPRLKGVAVPITFSSGNYIVTSPKEGVGTKTCKIYAVIKQSGANKLLDTITEIIDVMEFRDTLLEASLGTWSPNVDSLKTFTYKVIFEVPKFNSDSTFSDKVTKKSKTIKCIGKFAGERYGTFGWDKAMLLKYGNSVKLPEGHTAFSGNPNTAYPLPTYSTAANIVTDSATLTMLQAGDIIENADGSRKGLVYSVGTRDPKKGYKVRVYERICSTAALKKSTWTMVQTTGMKKGDETGVWTKFSRKQ